MSVLAADIFKNVLVLVIHIVVSKNIGLLYNWDSLSGLVVRHTADVIRQASCHGLLSQGIRFLRYRLNQGSGMWDHLHGVPIYGGKFLSYNT